MTRTRILSARAGYTLVELLVVMSLIILLAALALGVSQTGMFGSQKVISAGDRVSGWLLIAKQRAVRDGAPRGVRFFTSPGDPTRFTEAQYIEAPDAWVPNPGQETNPTGARIVFVYAWTAGVAPAPNAVSLREVYYVGSTADLAEYDQRVSDGDSLVLPEFGKAFRITTANISVTASTYLGPVFASPLPGPSIPANTLLVGGSIATSNARRMVLATLPDLSAAGTQVASVIAPHMATMTTYKFGFQRSPQPLLGEPALQLTGGTAIDYRQGMTSVALGATVDSQGYRTSFGGVAGPYNPPTTFGVLAVTDTASVGGLTFDIIFSPSGQVLNNNAGLICLWVRDMSKGVAHPRLDSTTGACDPSVVFDAAGQQALVVLNTKNGLISTQEIIPPPAGSNPTAYDPYRSAKDGINNGL